MQIDLQKLISLLKHHSIIPGESIIDDNSIYIDPRIYAYCKRFNERHLAQDIVVIPWLYIHGTSYTIKPFYLYGSTSDSQTPISTLVPYFIGSNIHGSSVDVANVFYACQEERQIIFISEEPVEE